MPWGVALTLGGTFSSHDEDGIYADMAAGGYVLAHIGVPRAGKIPSVYFAVGGGVELYQGIPEQMDGPTVVSAFAGLGFPRAGGLLLGVRHHWTMEALPVGEFNFTALEARIVSARRTLFFAIGTRVTLRTTRPPVDVFSGGPIISLFVELGWSIGGHGLSR